MKCPSCKDVTLTMSERQGIEIDYCPQCRGIWLDRGELDKLLERAQANAAQDERRSSPPPNVQHNEGYARQPDHYRDGHKTYHKKPKNWLTDIFD